MLEDCIRQNCLLVSVSLNPNQEFVILDSDSKLDVNINKKVKK
jgi:hypothetical protein